jgi:predicted AlkP superfamily phosphohydrolase/phosphomutase
MPRMKSGYAPRIVLLALASVLLLLPEPALAYIGPGAGFALLSSFLVVFTTILIALLSLLIWPFRMAWRFFRRKSRAKPWVRRLIIVGFDGQDPKLTEKFMKKGLLPNFEKLAKMGAYRKLETSYPSISPVAWSCFATGTNPARHNIFDFLDRDRKTYLPLLSSTHIGSIDRSLKIGKYRIPLSKPELRLLRKSKPFWAILGENDVWATVLRVPITFPPDKFKGAQLSAMCVPDLLGTQGTFLFYTTRPAEKKFKEGGIRVELPRNGDRISTRLQGPENLFRDGNPPLEIPMTIDLDQGKKRARVTLDGETVELEERKLSDWIPLSFKAAPAIKVSGLCRMMVTEMGEHFSLYVTPLNLDPDKPAMPISHPSYYATYLSKKIGHFCTLGLAEDTWALNEGVIDDATFLKQTYDIDKERQDMFFAALDRLRQGALVTVFDATDRIQHMFWHYLEENHPANNRNGGNGGASSPHRKAIEEIYKHDDAFVGQVMSKMKKGDVLIVLSDHGFSSFQRGVNLNGWLLKEGFLKLKDGADGSAEWLKDVDWSRTKAYSLGLSGMYLNIEGREANGILKPGAEAQAVKKEIIARMRGLKDDGRGVVGIQDVFDTASLYEGPYLENAPDLIIGYANGYRISWDCATGMVSGPVFEDNVKAWSGDHCVDPRLVPGVLFCNYAVGSENPSLVDLAPSVLTMFGISPPKHMEGKPLFTQETFHTGR